MPQTLPVVTRPGKPFVTTCNVTACHAAQVARSRSDTDWSRAEGQWQRLIWARRAHGSFRSAADFARAIRVSENTYRAYERDPDTGKSIKLSYDNAVAWADKLDVRWQWLFRGDGLPWRDEPDAELPPEATEASAILAAEDDPDERRRMLDVLRAMKRTGTSG